MGFPPPPRPHREFDWRPCFERDQADAVADRLRGRRMVRGMIERVEEQQGRYSIDVRIDDLGQTFNTWRYRMGDLPDWVRVGELVYAEAP